jgi:hypothetical protein
MALDVAQLPKLGWLPYSPNEAPYSHVLMGEDKEHAWAQLSDETGTSIERLQQDGWTLQRVCVRPFHGEEAPEY